MGMMGSIPYFLGNAGFISSTLAVTLRDPKDLRSQHLPKPPAPKPRDMG